MSKPKTSIKEIPVANDRLYKEVAALNGRKPSEIEQIMKFVSGYVRAVMLAGTMESVMLPHFGKFKPKPKKIRGMKKAQMDRRTGKNLVEAALQGKNLIDYRDETIRDRQ